MPHEQIFLHFWRFSQIIQSRTLQEVYPISWKFLVFYLSMLFTRNVMLLEIWLLSDSFAISCLLLARTSHIKVALSSRLKIPILILQQISVTHTLNRKIAFHSFSAFVQIKTAVMIKYEMFQIAHFASFTFVIKLQFGLYIVSRCCIINRIFLETEYIGTVCT